jgi:hypothetical protein
VLTGGDASGANIGIGFKDSAFGSDLFRVRINKTGPGLALNTYFNSGAGDVYTGLHTFTSVYDLTSSLKIRAVVDLDANVADIYMTEGAGTETHKGQVALRTDAVWDQLSFTTINNSTDWGVNDVVEIDYLKIRKLEVDNYDLWVARVDWAGATLTAPGDNPDGDRLVNLLEYVLGGDPTAEDASSVFPSIQTVNGERYYTFTLGVDSVDIPMEVQHSPDLVDWTTLSPTPVKGQIGQTIEIPLIDESLNKRFSRLSVSE